jgi:very-long-chain enoyl-CoA reductase
MRKIPATIEITPTTTIDEAKKIIAKAARLSDPYRIAIVDPSTKAIIKERFSPLADQKNVINAKQIYVKDLGRPHFSHANFTSKQPANIPQVLN